MGYPKNNRPVVFKDHNENQRENYSMHIECCFLTLFDRWLRWSLFRGRASFRGYLRGVVIKFCNLCRITHNNIEYRMVSAHPPGADRSRWGELAGFVPMIGHVLMLAFFHISICVFYKRVFRRYILCAASFFDAHRRLRLGQTSTTHVSSFTFHVEHSPKQKMIQHMVTFTRKGDLWHQHSHRLSSSAFIVPPAHSNWERPKYL